MEGGVIGDFVLKMGRRSVAETTTPRNKPMPPATPSGESGYPRPGRLGSAGGPSISESPQAGSRTWMWIAIAVVVLILLAANTGLLINLVLGNNKENESTAHAATSPTSSGSAGTPAKPDIISGVPAALQTSHLTATFDPYPPSNARGDATLDAGSQVWITSQLGGGFTMHYYLKGLPALESMGGFSVYTAETCSMLEADLGQRAFVHTPVLTAMWSKEPGAVEARGSVSVPARVGFPLAQLQRHALVVQQESGERVGCGLLRFQHAHLSVGHLSARLRAYPPSEATGAAALGADSQVWLTANAGGGYRVHYWLTGLPAAELSGGLHVHTGTSCAAHDKVLGHYFSTAEDPWSSRWEKPAGATVAAGWVDVASAGFGLEMNAGHAFVVHEEGGKRVGCGELQAVAVGPERLQEEVAALRAQNEALRALLSGRAPEPPRRAAAPSPPPRAPPSPHGAPPAAPQQYPASILGGTRHQARRAGGGAEGVDAREVVGRQLKALSEVVGAAVELDAEGRAQFELRGTPVRVHVPAAGSAVMLSSDVADLGEQAAAQRQAAVEAVEAQGPGGVPEGSLSFAAHGVVRYTRVEEAASWAGLELRELTQKMAHFVAAARALAAAFDALDTNTARRSSPGDAEKKTPDPRRAVEEKLAELGSALGGATLDAEGTATLWVDGQRLRLRAPEAGRAVLLSTVVASLRGLSPQEQTQRLWALGEGVGGSVHPDAISVDPGTGDVVFSLQQSAAIVQLQTSAQWLESLRKFAETAKTLAAAFA